MSKGNINFGSITARPNGAVDTSQVDGVNPDLRVRPFFLHGDTISMREFLIGAFNAEMGLEAVDPELRAAAAGARFVTPSGMTLDGDLDTIETPPVNNEFDDSDNDGVVNEIPTSLVDFMEFYLLHYFKPGLGEGSPESIPPGSGYPAPTFGDAYDGLKQFRNIGCATCHCWTRDAKGHHNLPQHPSPVSARRHRLESARRRGGTRDIWVSAVRTWQYQISRSVQRSQRS